MHEKILKRIAAYLGVSVDYLSDKGELTEDEKSLSDSEIEMITQFKANPTVKAIKEINTIMKHKNHVQLEKIAELLEKD